MSTEIISKIQGTCTGFNGGAVFKLTNGQAWQQKVHKYTYRYKYRPDVRIYQADGTFYIAIEGMDEVVPVVQVSILEDGVIVSEFNGFDQNVRFEFQSGRIWVPTEYKYVYHYEYRPQAIIVDGINGPELMVDGMNETIRVRRT
ncbi:MAG: hypothetical protein WCO56_02220 [Verrucomicrobiota bacterium]